MSSTLTKLARLLGFILLALLIFGYAFGSYFFSSVLLAGSTRSLARSEETSSERSQQILAALPAAQTVRFENGEQRLEGWYFDHPDTTCGVVLLHGYSDNRWGMIAYLPIFWEQQCDLLLYDARGHGNSGNAFHTYGYAEKRDAETAVRWLAAQANLSLEQIGLMGTSYGAATALQAAPNLPDLGFIIADSAYQDLETIIRYQAGSQYGTVGELFVPSAFLIAEARAAFEADDVSAQTAVRQANMPILLIHSLQDEYTFPTHSEAIFANSNQSQTVLEITDWGAAHGQSVTADFVAYEAMVRQFLAEFAPQFLP